MASTNSTLEMLSFPENYQAEEIPAGCCGMAGGFGYEIANYKLSIKNWEMILSLKSENSRNSQLSTGIQLAVPFDLGQQAF